MKIISSITYCSQYFEFLSRFWRYFDQKWSSDRLPNIPFETIFVNVSSKICLISMEVSDLVDPD